MLTGLPDLEADKKFPGVFRKDDFVGTRASYIIPYALGHCSNLQQVGIRVYILVVRLLYL